MSTPLQRTHITITGINNRLNRPRHIPTVSLTQSLISGIAMALFVVGGAMMLGVLG